MIESDVIGLKPRVPSSDSYLDLSDAGRHRKSRGRATIRMFDEYLVLPDGHSDRSALGLTG
jgi:hypothetical protein